MTDFCVYPAIDLREGQVVRLKEGDLNRITQYGSDPRAIAEQWVRLGARFLHVVNLDGAFGGADAKNLRALAEILEVCRQADVPVQFGGGIRSLADVDRVLEMGVMRAILGTVVIESPEVLREALEKWGAERVAVSIDARDGLARTRGWQEGTQIEAVTLAKELSKLGLRWLIFTDIARDGLETGLNISATKRVADESGLNVIASGGVSGWVDIRAAYEAGLAGSIVGRALYEGNFDAKVLFAFDGGEAC